MKILHALVEGGQTWTHRIRMVRQVLKTALYISIMASLIYLGYTVSKLDRFLLQSTYYFYKAELAQKVILNEISVSPAFLERNTIQKRSKLSTNYVKKLTQPQATYLGSLGKSYLWKSLKIAGFVFFGMLKFFMLRGVIAKRKKHISGRKLIHPFFLYCQLLLRRKASDIKIGYLPLIRNTETQHILVTGGTGSGKTNSFHHLLPQIKDKNQKALIIDTSGVFIDRYYNPKTDVILNPFDGRGEPWHPWAECNDSFDFDNLAESMIPQSYNDHENYWRTAARCLYSTLLQKLQDAKKTPELAQWILYEPLDRLAEFVQNTKAAAHIDTTSEKTAASIRSVAASFLGSLEYLKDCQNPFSLKKTIQDENQKGWIFLNAKPSQRATLNPLIACWFSIAVRSLIQLPVNLQRRQWFVIDELPTLHKLKDLDTLVTESRKYGGCALLALQSPSQLEEIYGKHTTQTIIGNCATRIVFAEHDAETSAKISRSLGENEIREFQEGISYGAHEVRDGVTLSNQIKKKPTIAATDIQSLKNNYAYIKLPGNTPISKIYLKTKV